jgi:hypothetical protein
VRVQVLDVLRGPGSAHGAHHTVGAARDLGAAHLASASARKPLISAGLQGFLGRSCLILERAVYHRLDRLDRGREPVEVK